MVTPAHSWPRCCPPPQSRTRTDPPRRHVRYFLAPSEACCALNPSKRPVKKQSLWNSQRLFLRAPRHPFCALTVHANWPSFIPFWIPKKGWTWCHLETSSSRQTVLQECQIEPNISARTRTRWTCADVAGHSVKLRARNPRWKWPSSSSKTGPLSSLF